MRSFLPLAAVVALAVAAPAAAQQARSVAGEWQGGYVSGDGSDVNTFTITFNQRGAALTGTVVEINTIGDPGQALFLTSTLTGSLRGDGVEFIKTYDGSGGVSHSVTYRGRLESNGRRVRGTYDAGGATGTFELAR